MDERESGLLFLAPSAKDAKAAELRSGPSFNGLWPGISWVVVGSGYTRQGINPVKPIPIKQ